MTFGLDALFNLYCFLLVLGLLIGRLAVCRCVGRSTSGFVAEQSERAIWPRLYVYCVLDIKTCQRDAESERYLSEGTGMYEATRQSRPFPLSVQQIKIQNPHTPRDWWDYCLLPF